MLNSSNDIRLQVLSWTATLDICKSKFIRNFWYIKVNLLWYKNSLRWKGIEMRQSRKICPNYSRLSLSRSWRDPLKHFEISVLRHIRFSELRKMHIEQPNFTIFCYLMLDSTFKEGPDVLFEICGIRDNRSQDNESRLYILGYKRILGISVFEIS